MTSSSMSAARIVFVLSAVFFAFLYGIVTRAFGWFPSELLESAYNQARAVSPLQPRMWTSTRVYDRYGARAVEPASIDSGLTLISARWLESGWKPTLKLIDISGTTVHEWEFEPNRLFGEPFKSIHGFHLLADGDVLVNFNYAGTVRANACGDVVWKLEPNSHHSIHRSEDGSFWISAMARGTARHPAWQVDGPGPVYRDRILHVSGDGEIIDQIDLLEVLADDEATLPYLMRHQEGSDVTHLNDVEPLADSLAAEYPLFEKGDLLVSLKHLNLVFVFDPTSGEVKWHASEPFIQQHDPDFMGNGWIGLFDNREDGTYRGKKLGGSRIVALQPHTDSTEIHFPTAGSDPFHTPNMGTWQELASGNLLLTESRAGRVVEVTPDGRTAWEWIAPPYNESEVPEVYQSARYDLTVDEVESWPCASQNETDNLQGRDS